MRTFLFVLLLHFSFNISAQNFARQDSIKGKPVSVREELIFLDSAMQNRKLFSTEGDYGHYGFVSPEFTTGRFTDWWYNTYWVHYLNYYREWDTAGNLKKEIWYRKSSDSQAVYLYEYNNRNNCIEKKILHPNLWTDIQIYNYTDYDNLKKSEMLLRPYTIVKMKNFTDTIQATFSFQLFKYDSLKQLIEKSNFDEEGFSYSVLYKYDTAGRVIHTMNRVPYVWINSKGGSRQEHSDSGTIMPVEDKLYNDNGTVREIRYFTEDFYDRNKPRMYKKELYTYDKEDRVIQITYDSTFHRELEYHTNGLLKTMANISTLKSPFAQPQLEYLYDNNSNLIKLLYTEADVETVVKFNYTWDDHGNWTSQIKSVNGKNLYLRKRQIVYR